MRSEKPRYPVDRYMVESSKHSEMVNITDDEIWNTEPMLRPEDEIVLKKLHEMLQSTADDLKLLSGELSKFHEPGVQVRALPTPLDEEFNEKVHIEEIVNAKFHGHKMIDKLSSPSPSLKSQKEMVDTFKNVSSILHKPKVSNTGVQVNVAPINKKTLKNKNLGISGTKIVQINEAINQNGTNDKINDNKIVNNTPAVAYNEFSYKYVEPKEKVIVKKSLNIQEMPSINIRSELKEQKVLHLDIIPEDKDVREIEKSKNNVAVIAMQHEVPPQKIKLPVPNYVEQYCQPTHVVNKQPVRKVSKMSTCDSSGSTNNISSDAQHKLKIQKQMRTAIRSSPMSSTRERDRSKKGSQKKESDKRTHFNLDEWKRKVNLVYGQPSTSRKIKTSKNVKNISPKKSNPPSRSATKLQKAYLNNAEYIPYSKLTLGGVNVSDIEKEISNIPNKNDIPLSPILDKMLSSRESSCHSSPRKHKQKDKNIFTTSDENLLQEVIDIERTVSETLSKNLKKVTESPANTKNVPSKNNVNTTDNDSYADDFEEEKSDNSEHTQKQSNDDRSEPKNSNKSNSDTEDAESSYNYNEDVIDPKKSKVNRTISKASNLSFKNTVDIFEFVHSVDTQDTATQSNATQKISLKETQTSPRNDRSNIQPIHNDLWPSIDPKGEVEKMFKLEKDFIKQLIIDEYGDLLESSIAKPSTSKASNELEHVERNIVASQKNTQTSPAHVKNVMTSPTRTKTRTTSPFALSLTVDKQSSPLVLVTSEEELKVKIEKEEDFGISINLSSPRFSLRLPQTSREVLSNLEVCSHTSKVQHNVDDRESNLLRERKAFRKSTTSGSSSADADNSSSEISSLGEIKWKLKRRLRKNRVPTISESSSSSTLTKCSSDLPSCDILPLRSEGELSLGQVSKKNNKPSKSDGEMSFGPM